MRLTYRPRITYVIYTEEYSNARITRQQMIESANECRGVIGAYPYGINDELVITLCHDYDIYNFMIDFKYKLDKLLETKL